MKRNLLFLKARTLLAALIALAAFMPPAAAEESSQNPNARLNFTFQHTEVKKILEEVEKQSDYYFVYNHEQVDVDRRVSIRVENETIQRVLQMLFEGTDVKYEIRGRQIALSPATHVVAGAQQTSTGASSGQPLGAMRDGSQARPGSGIVERRTVNGRVRDVNGEPLVGASVVTPDFLTGVATDAEGRFLIYVPRSVRMLRISMVGFENVEQTIPESGEMVVTMKDHMQAISEAIITGYQTVDHERSAGSASTAPMDIINQRNDGNIIDKLEGLIPGLYRHQGTYNIRGVATIFGEQQPLYVIDGYPVDTDRTVDNAYAGKSPLASLNPRDIANITVLKDAAAASIYGVRGANGVIVITTHSGQSGKTRVNVHSSLTIEPIPDYSKLNQMNSRELVDFQKKLFEAGGSFYEGNDEEVGSAVLEAMYNHMNRPDTDPHYITEAQMNSILDRLSRSNNLQQVEDNLMQSALTQEHAVSARGGTETHRYYLSVDYKGLRRHGKGGKENYVNVFLKEQADLAKWLSIDGAATIRMSNAKADGNSYGSLIGHYAMPYNMLIDENGDLTKMYRLKSQIEIENLIAEGLEDESSNPITERGMRKFRNEDTYLRLQGGMTIKPVEGLSLNISYQTERNYSHKRDFNHADSYVAKNIRNNATSGTPGAWVKNIPYGGIMFDLRENMKNYMFRVQANFDRTFGGKHYVSALAGAERRSEVYGFTSFYKLAYDETQNLYQPIDVAKLLSGIYGQGIGNGLFRYNDTADNRLYDSENRFVSFYGNAGYTYDDRYTATFSIRMDDTNLFGSNPKYRYLPMWSAGLKWIATKENFLSNVPWLDHLALRMTYGITGNVYHGTGPFLIANTELNAETGVMGTVVTSPPNESLRWEKTAVFNVGVDMSVLDNRLHATLEFYNRNTTDLLAEPQIDPTNYPATNYNDVRIMQNFGTLYNRGFELSLRALAVKAGDFSWNSSLNFSHNVNEITKGNDVENTVLSLIKNDGCLVEGRPRDAIFRFRYAGLNPADGSIMVYKAGETDPVGSLEANDLASLVYSGTLRPKWTSGFINTFKWRGLSLMVQIVANGGHVMLDPMPNLLGAGSYALNPDRRAANFWREAGDENKKGIMPAPVFGPVDGQYNAMWYAADKHVMPADYIKVRNINLGYEIPRQWFGRTMFESAQLTLQVRNPFVLWTRNREHIDPEALNYDRSGLPLRAIITPQYIIGLDFTF